MTRKGQHQQKQITNYSDEQAPDCSTCIRRKGCERAAENSYCTRWADREPEPKGADPNEAWERGVDIPYI